MRLRNRKSFVTNLPDSKPPRDWRPKLTQAIYLAVLFGFVGYAAYYIGDRLLNFEARGQVVTERTLVSPVRGGRIVALPAQPGTDVQAGTLLARLEPASICEPLGQRELDQLRRDLDLARVKLQLAEQQLAALHGALDGLTLQRSLELDPDLSRRQRQLRDDIDEARMQQRLLKEQIRLDETQVAQQLAEQRPDPRCQPEMLHAPFAGRVHSVQLKAFEVIAAGQPLLTLEAADAPVRVFAYLEEDEYPQAFPGKPVTVVLPDGSESSAPVKAVHSSAYPFATLQWQGYQPEQTAVLVEIAPRDDAQREAWRRFDRLEVEVRGSR